MLDEIMVKEIGVKWIALGAGNNAIATTLKGIEMSKALEIINLLSIEEYLHPDTLNYLRLAVQK